jgi:hypothetical protein
VIALVAAGPAQAQDKKEVQGYFAAGYVSPEGDVSKLVNGGMDLSGGVILRPAPEKHFGVRFDLGYNVFGATTFAIDTAQQAGLRVDGGGASLGTLTVEGLYEFGGHGRVNGYIGVGIGGMRRYGRLTTTVLTNGWWCDPWTGICYPGYTSGDAIVKDDSLTKMEYSAAAGITIAAGSGAFYLETRYHWMYGADKSTQM